MTVSLDRKDLAFLIFLVGCAIVAAAGGFLNA